MVSVASVSLAAQTELTPLTDWFNAHPDAVIVSINLDGGTFYIFYT